MNTLPKPILAIIISFSFTNRAVCKRWRDTVKYTFDEDDFYQICARGTASVMKMFLAQYSAQDWFIGSKLISASGNLELLKFMRKNYSHDDRSVLAKACAHRHLSIVKYLVYKGTESSNYIIRHAYKGGCGKIIKIIHENSCLRDNWPISALTGAATGSHEEILMSLFESYHEYVRENVVFEAVCASGNLKIVSALFEFGKSTHCINNGLYYACKKKSRGCTLFDSKRRK